MANSTADSTVVRADYQINSGKASSNLGHEQTLDSDKGKDLQKLINIAELQKSEASLDVLNASPTSKGNFEFNADKTILSTANPVIGFKDSIEIQNQTTSASNRGMAQNTKAFPPNRSKQNGGLSKRPPLIITTDQQADNLAVATSGEMQIQKANTGRSVTETSEQGSPLIRKKGRGGMKLLSATSEKLAETIQ